MDSGESQGIEEGGDATKIRSTDLPRDSFSTRIAKDYKGV
jgi:hypothetical protein